MVTSSNNFFNFLVNGQSNFNGVTQTTDPQLLVPFDPFNGRGNNFLNPNFVGNQVTSVPLRSRDIFFGTNPDFMDIERITRSNINRIFNTTPFQTMNIRLDANSNPFHPIPDLGLNPNANQVLGNTLFFQQTIRPEVNTGSGSLFSAHPDSLGIMFDVISHGNALIGKQSIFNTPIALQNVNTGTPFGSLVPFNPDNPVNNNTPILGMPNLSGFPNGSAFTFSASPWDNLNPLATGIPVTPVANSFGGFNAISPTMISGASNGFFFGNGALGGFANTPAINFPNTITPSLGSLSIAPVNVSGFNPSGLGLVPLTGEASLIQSLIKTNLHGAGFPNYVPTNVTGGVPTFLQQFPFQSATVQNDVRTQFSNETQVNTAILNRTGITLTDGKYRQGRTLNPFAVNGFLTDTNPFAKTNSGMVVTNGNNNGAVKGTQARDLIFGRDTGANIVDGMGGGDTVITSNQNDLINAHVGDEIHAMGSNDVIFYDFTKETAGNTAINGGEGNDTLVLTIGGDPSQTANLPNITRLPSGLLQIIHNGQTLLATGIEKILITDTAGNVGTAL